MQKLHTLKLHKVNIQSLSFSADEKYLASLGGQDDNQLVIWEVSIFEYIITLFVSLSHYSVCRLAKSSLLIAKKLSHIKTPSSKLFLFSKLSIN